MTIRTRLAIWYSGLLALLVIAVGLTFIIISRITIINTVDQLLEETADKGLHKFDDFTSGVDEIGFESLQERIDGADIFHIPGVSVQIWYTLESALSDGPMLIRSSGDIADVSTPIDPMTIRVSQSSFSNVTINGINQRVLSHPIITEGGTPIGVIQTAISVSALGSISHHIWVLTIIITLIAVLISICLGLWLSGHLLKPIKLISETTSRIVSADDLSTRLDWSGSQSDELGELTKVFNRMIERLENIFMAQQRFINDVSHELRTPLTMIQGHLDIIERCGYDESSLESMRRASNRMNRLVEDLLLLGRVDSGELKVNRVLVDLDHAVLSAYEHMLETTRNRNLSVVIERIEPIKIEGDFEYLRILLRSLLHNAVKFTDDGGQITIEVYQEDASAIIAIQDTGIGIDEAAQQHIFERFYQADTSRNHTDSDGVGLGLTIADWIVRSHQGMIEVSSELGAGARFRVILPLPTKQLAPFPRYLPNKQFSPSTDIPSR